MFCRVRLYLVLIGFVCAFAGTTCADIVKVDLLGGIGDFEYSGDTRWYSGYTGSDYNFDTQSGYTTARDSAGWQSGYDPATPENSVAVGWLRRTGPSVHPRNNVTYSIVTSDSGSGNCQYFCMKKLVGDNSYARLETDLKVRSTPSDLHVGDYVTFHVDSIRMAGYDDLPTGSHVQFKIGFAGGAAETLTPSDSDFSYEISTYVSSSTGGWVTPYFSIIVDGPLAAAQPGIYVDGAHAYVKRAENPADYATWEVPVVPNKGVKTLLDRSDWQKSPHDLYSLAKNCDAIVVGDQDGALAARLKYLNPDLKTYLYQIYTCLDMRDSRGNDAWYSSSPTQLAWVRKNSKTQWLYSGGYGSYGYVNEPQYPYSYYMKVTDSAYQSYWLGVVKEKALRWKHNGVFLDSINALTSETYAGKTRVPGREPSEVQKFLHAVVPTLRNAGLDVVANAGGCTMSIPTSSIFLSPRWAPYTPYNTVDYTSNQAYNVPNIVFQEYGFIKYNAAGNVYDPTYWKLCLQDMDAVKNWNTSGAALVPAKDRIYYVVQAIGVDKPTDPAEGANGWYQFGLASYLLGQNDFTYFSWNQPAKTTAGEDYSPTAIFGIPFGNRTIISGDPCFVYRKYTLKGGGSAVVVVNANSAMSRRYPAESDLIDESGNTITAGTQVLIKPHTGRIFTLKN